MLAAAKRSITILSVRRQMGRDSGEHLAADALDVAGAQMVPEQTGDIGCAWRMAEGRRKLSAGEDRMSRQEARGEAAWRFYMSASEWAINSHSNANMSTFPSRRPGSGGRSLGYEKRAERAKNYPSQPIFQNKPPWRKDRQRYARYMTVPWISARVHFKKDRQKYRQLICYQRRLKLARRFAYSLCISISYEVSARGLTMHLDCSRILCKLLK